MLKDKDGISPHTVAEVLLNGKWRVFDPLNGLVFRKKDGSLATLEEISQDPTIINKNPKVQWLSSESKKEFISWYGRMFPMPREPRRWSSLLDKKNRNHLQKLANNSINLTVKLFGRVFINSYQDLYLLTNAAGSDKPEEKLYFKARDYHLYRRVKLAEKTYKEIIKDYPDSKFAEDSQFFLAKLHVELLN